MIFLEKIGGKGQTGGRASGVQRLIQPLGGVQIRYDTIQEFNVDSKAEYTA